MDVWGLQIWIVVDWMERKGREGGGMIRSTQNEYGLCVRLEIKLGRKQKHIWRFSLELELSIFIGSIVYLV